MSYELSYMENDKTFEEISTDRWTEAAEQFVRSLCKGRTVGTLTDYTFDTAGKKCQGVLEINGYKCGPINLNQMLVKAKHARVVTDTTRPRTVGTI